ncbi:MAG TPA: transporter [Ignavibacteria bacterium]
MRKINFFYFIFILFISTITSAIAGPPYDTDDPEPVEFRNWEFYLSSRPVHDDAGWNGTAPHAEVNYGVVNNLQLHIILPLAFNSPNGGKSNYGLGDIELGFKYRFIKETSSTPQIGIFPMVDIPTGNQNKGLGNGGIQVFLPVWIQKSFGKWTTYGGAGYRINNVEGNKNSVYMGWLLQNHVRDNLSIGVELYHITPETVNGEAENRFNIGTVYDISDNHHLLFSAGRSLSGSTSFQGYLGYQLTFGPK